MCKASSLQKLTKTWQQFRIAGSRAHDASFFLPYQFFSEQLLEYHYHKFSKAIYSTKKTLCNSEGYNINVQLVNVDQKNI